VLYLAEVQKKTKLLGSGKAELKLLAQQRAEERWQVLTSGEVMSSEKANDFNAGSLVLVDVSDKSGQIQQVKDATRLILSNLQKSSQLQEKLKGQEDEIEQWKQSLTYQSQELNRREMEMEARREQMQQLEEEMVQLEQQKQEALTLRETAQQLRTELEGRDQELQQAREALESEQAALETRKQEIQSSAVLNSDQVIQVQERLNQFAEIIIPSDAVRGEITSSLEVLNQQKLSLEQHWQFLEQHQGNAYQLQEEATQLAQTIHEGWDRWYQSQAELEQAKLELTTQEQNLKALQDRMQMTQQHLVELETLQQQLAALGGGLEPEVAQQIDFEALENMPLKNLEERVQEIEKDYKKTFNFVNDQEEELRLLSQDIEAKKSQIQEASEYDRLTLDNELSDLQSEYQLFDESVVPQRKRLREAKAVLAAHQAALARRKGQPVESEDGESTIDLTPVLTQVNGQRQQYGEALQTVGTEIEQLQALIQQTHDRVAHGDNQQQQQRQELQQSEETLRNQSAMAAELWGQVKTYQELLQPTQENLNGLDQRIQAMNEALNRVQEVGDYQLQLLAELKQAVADLTA
jgi:chromosome segregation ATPase